MFILTLIAIGLAIIISLILAEAHAEPTHAIHYSSVIPPGFKIRLKQLCLRSRHMGRFIYHVRWITRQFKAVTRRDSARA